MSRDVNQEGMDDATWIREVVGKADTPQKILRVMYEHSGYFGFDAYCQDLRGAMLEQASKVLRACDDKQDLAQLLSELEDAKLNAQDAGLPLTAQTIEEAIRALEVRATTTWTQFDSDNPPDFGLYWVARREKPRAEMAELTYNKPRNTFYNPHEGSLDDVTHYMPYSTPPLPEAKE